MRRSTIIGSVICLAVLAFPTGSRAQGIKGRELLGLRAGAVISTGGVNTIFGNGSELEIHFIEGLNPWLGISISLSSHNFGESNDRDKNIEFTGLDRPVDLNIFSVTVAAIAVNEIGKKLASTVEGGLGLYTVNAIIQAGLFEGTRTNNQFGFYGGAGLLYRLTRSFSFNANAKYHYVFTGDDDRHTIHFYTDEDRISFFQIAVGVTIFTG
jgi:opacity protein-like surface antigen